MSGDASTPAQDQTVEPVETAQAASEPEVVTAEPPTEAALTDPAERLQQLEQELEANAWIRIEPDHELIFLSENEPAWTQAIAKLGIDPGQLASVGGHA